MTTPRIRPFRAASPTPVDESNLPAALACTKVRPPVLRDDAIARGRLLEGVREILERCPILLVCAPAGYGKTTLLASLPIAQGDVRVAWITVDEEDNDASRFSRAIVQSLRAVEPHLSERSAVTGDVNATIDGAINELSRTGGQRVVLVLDELQRVSEPEALKCVVRLAERLPRALGLAIGSRYRPALPLARWKARRIIGELGLRELAFTPAEAKEYLHFAHGLDVSEALAGELTERTDGWPAALTLLGDALAPDALTELDAAAVHHRDIDALLEQEVFAELDAELRRFVLETSVLPELTPALCRAVTERADAPALLDELVRLNLVVSVNDRPDTPFRYPEMFRRFLERRLVVELPESVPGLERRAAQARARATAPAVRIPETGASLSPREIEVLHLVAAGASNAEIAEKLFISVHTVKRHVATLLDKLAADSRARASATARRLGIVS